MALAISQSLAQQIVGSVKDVCGQDINFINPNGIILTSTNEARIGEFHEIGKKVAETKCTIEVMEDNSFMGTHKGVNLPVQYKGSVIAVIGISGAPDEVRKYAQLAEKITYLLIKEQEYNALSRSQAEKRSYIIHSLISGENPGNEYLAECMNEFHLDLQNQFRVLCIHLNGRYHTNNLPLMEQKINQLFSVADVRLYTYQYPYDYLAVLSTKKFQLAEHALRTFAENHASILKVCAGSVCSLYQMAHSYQDCKIALQSTRYLNTSYVKYDDLNLEMLLGDVPVRTKNEYLKKILHALTPEDLSILDTYYEMQMSLDQTSKKLFLHKNTLQYRLDRIHRLCGFNPRRFQDAVVLYLALRLKLS